MDITLIIMIFPAFYFIRNTAVYLIRNRIIDGNMDDYLMMPSYDRMLFHPSQLHLWTTWQYRRQYKING